MIEKVRVTGYRKFRDLVMTPHPRFNIVVGDNESGKSTLLEALGLALTGRVNGRPASEELNPYWFNKDMVEDFFTRRKNGEPVAPPRIEIEVFLRDLDDFQRNLYGANNSETPTRECAGIRLIIAPNPEYAEEIEAHLTSDTSIIPVEYYTVEWRSFGDILLTARPRELTTAIIDSRTIRSTGGVDFHLRQILSDHLDSEEKAAISLAFRMVKEQLTTGHLQDVNEKIAALEGALDDETIALAMDQSSRGSWDAAIVPHVASVPFALAGQGQQAAVKIALAMGQKASNARVVMVEEPENHLSHTSLNKVLRRMDDVAGDEQQLFITTHSSFVLNRLGVDSLTFLNDGAVSTMQTLHPETVDYFKKLPGHDTLRMVLARRFVLVEGPSDELVFERLYLDARGRRPMADGIDVISMRGLSLRRCLALGQALGKRCVAVRDNDGIDPAAIEQALGGLVDNQSRAVRIGDLASGPTLEPQLLTANPDQDLMRRVLGITEKADLLTWMTNNKTEAALRILAAPEKLTAPPYLASAIGFISDGLS